MDDAYITDVACGADFTLALESQGQLWAWGSNFYSQVGVWLSVVLFFMSLLSATIRITSRSTEENCDYMEICLDISKSRKLNSTKNDIVL